LAAGSINTIQFRIICSLATTITTIFQFQIVSHFDLSTSYSSIFVTRTFFFFLLAPVVVVVVVEVDESLSAAAEASG